ncbi:MAG: hypothetical protein JW846_11570 [Dehalococcoidia bacterium]|nr:hypothetical protein [Dehalococcoidia bacterium]
MTQMTGLERMMTTLQLKEPDIVPHFETSHHKLVREGILPGASYEDFLEYIDVDAVAVVDKISTWKYEPIDSKTKRDQWGGISLFTREDIGHPLKPAIESEHDLDHYVPPNPDDDYHYEVMKERVARFKGRKAIIAHMTDVFDVAKESLLGDVKYFTSMKRNPDLLDRVNEIVLTYYLRYIGNCIDLGADLVFVTGDWAMTNGPMASVEMTKRFIAPPFARIAEYCHSRGIPCMKHSDGNIWPLFDTIVEAGADAVHPIDPMGGMDMAEAKAKYGKKVCLMGNVSCAFSLVTGTPDEVRAETKEVIRKGGKGGGLICMSSNSIHSGVKPQNYQVMLETIREWGKYPLTWIDE